MPTVRIPDDNSSIHAIGDYILTYQSYQNAFLNALVNRIGRVIVTSRMWNNPWAVFKKGKLEYGETVEEIFANIAKPHSFDPSVAESEVFKREIPDVRAAFHTMNYQKFYKVTISNDQMRQAFLSASAITDLIARIVDSLYTAMHEDEYLTMKYMLCREMLNGGIYPVTIADVSDEEGNAYFSPSNAVKKFREYTNNLTFLKTQYNRARVWNSTPVEEQVIIISNEVEAVIGVDVLAQAFNLNYADYLGQRIAVDSFTFDSDEQTRLAELLTDYKAFTADEITNLNSVKGVKLDRDWFMVFDDFEQFTENYNGQGLYWQYFYHTWKTFSASPFANAIMFTNLTNAVTGVTLTNSSTGEAFTEGISVVKGYSGVPAQATVNGSGFVSDSIVWSIQPTTDAISDTVVNATSGMLTVGRNETADTFNLIATANDGVSAKVTVTVKS